MCPDPATTLPDGVKEVLLFSQCVHTPLWHAHPWSGLLGFDLELLNGVRAFAVISNALVLGLE